MTRMLWFAFGWVAVALGLIGVVLPGLPTTPFLLVAAFSFSRSSPRLRLWLENHPQFGPPIRDWEDRGAISARAKTLAVAMMGLVFAISLIVGMPGWVLAVQAFCLGGAATFILTRPD
ncbi:YbaN family protein [Maritimibacter fusiformis]|uniref:DUF454 domain-containing protein n=1 Tax=Maritimibacter fusiformis TaxID=2603819 RepID=A0A5D0RH63_9RHOB|nr:YbaN family protein [Maritimibacter fusiformis]TYB80960.1 DUF454 domain-containing protein [Maritimibacter fusiformis]